MKKKIETILNESRYNGLPTHIVAEQLLDLFSVMLSEIETNPRDKANEMFEDYREEASFVAGDMYAKKIIKENIDSYN